MRRISIVLVMLLALACCFGALAEEMAELPVDMTLAEDGTILTAYATETETVFEMRRLDGSHGLYIIGQEGLTEEIPLPEETRLETGHTKPGFVTVLGENADLPDRVTFQLDAYGTFLNNFQVGSCTYGRSGEHLSVHDEQTGLVTFYRYETWLSADTPFPDIRAWAERFPTTHEAVYAIDLENGLLCLPTGESWPLPANEEVEDSYDRGSRLFLSIDTADGGHLLRIVTRGETPEVLDVPIPWEFFFDTTHISEGEDDVLILDFEAGYDESWGVWYASTYFSLEDGRWMLRTIRNDGEVIAVEDYALWRDTDFNVTFGNHPWHELTTIDWSTLPVTFAEARVGLTKEGWLFAAEELSLQSAPDAAAEVVAVCAADTPLAVLRFEGDWALVGLHQPYMWDSLVGYVPTAQLRAEPEHVLPGGETDGWFYTMTVEEGILRFSTPDANWPFAALRVHDGFERVVRALYREQGYAATPARFDPALYPYLKGLVYHRYAIHDLFLTAEAAIVAVDTLEGVYYLSIVTDPAGIGKNTQIEIPGPFHFDREAWIYGDIEVVLEEMAACYAF